MITVQKEYKRKVSSKNQVTIPRLLGKRFGIYPNSSVFFKEENGRLYIDSEESMTNSKSANSLKGLYIDEDIILDLLESQQYKNNPQRLVEETSGEFCSTQDLLSSL